LDLPYRSTDNSAVVLDGEIHILGNGENNGSRQNHFKLNKTTNRWISVSTLPYLFNNGGNVVLDDEIHLLGGGSNSASHFYHYRIVPITADKIVESITL
jgi:hypothetical protein